MKAMKINAEFKFSLLPTLLFLFFLASSVFGHKVLAQNSDLSRPQEEFILYPGKFDPFHLSHYEELLYVKQTHPNAKAVILPIQDAHYRSHPLLFTYKQKVKFIEESFENVPDLEISGTLEAIKKDVFDELLDMRDLYPRNAKISIIIGTDILDIWQAKQGFQHLLAQYGLIVSKDSKNADLFETLQKKFSGNSNIEFVDSGTAGIRSSIIKKDIIYNAQEINHLLSAPAIKYLNKHPEFIQEIVSGYEERLFNYLSSRVNNELIPLMEKSSINRQMIATLKQFPDAINQLIFLDLERQASIGEVAEAIRLVIPHNMLNNSFDHLTRDLMLIVKEPQVEAFLSDENYSFDRDQMQLIRAKTKSVKNKSKGLLFSFMGKLRKVTASFPLIENLFLRFRNFANRIELEDTTALHSLLNNPYSSDKTITVYRGIKAKGNIEEVLDYTKKYGFISKVALTELKKGKSLEEAILASEKALSTQGLNNSIIDHIGGNWRNGSTFVATTLDYDVAAQWAAKDGYVFKFEIPINSGYFVNDPLFWKNTPWNKYGNIQKSLNEFVVKNIVPAEYITDIIKVKETPPIVVNDTYDSLQVWRAVPWKVEHFVKEAFSKSQCSSLFLKH